MSHTNGRSKHFYPIVLCIDDNFDVLELEKSILKEADYFPGILESQKAPFVCLQQEGPFKKFTFGRN